MRVAIVAPSPIPYGPGGAEAVWSGLYLHLTTHTAHDVELIKLPVRETTLPEVMAGYEAFAALDLSHFDVVLSGKYPAWMVEHPRHVVYLLHPLRGLYDSYGLFGRPFVESSTDPMVQALLAEADGLDRRRLPTLFATWHETLDALGPDHPTMTFPGPLARALVHAMDSMALSPQQVREHHAISWTVAGRAGYFPDGVGVRVVHPPSDLAGLHGGPGEYFFTASRHDGPKRLDLLIEGMQHYAGDRRLLIAGGGPQTARLKELAAGDDRIELIGRVSPAELVDHYSRAVGVPFIPFDEDLGLITHEAMASGKPVLTASDSGGPTELIRHGVNGLVVAPTPETIGAGLSELEALAARPRTAGEAERSVHGQTWSRVARELLRDSETALRVPLGRTGRPRVVVTSTFPVWPPRGGGQLRAFHLYGSLSETFDVDLVCQASSRTEPSSRVIGPGLTEHVVPRSAEHDEQEHLIAAAAGIPVTDIVAARLSHLSPGYSATLARLCDGAAGVLLADPFLFPVAERVAGALPMVYDAYNCELVLKSQMLEPGSVAEDLLAEVRDVEGRAARAARLVLTVSDEDRVHLADLYGIDEDNFVAAPNGTDLGSVHYTAPEVRRIRSARWREQIAASGGPVDLEHLALFVGSWHEPNNEAARAILEMARELPDVGFLLVGSHTGSLRHLPIPPNVFLLGVVADAVKTSLLATADVALAPLSSGSGTNLKVVEYLAAGVPVVSTAVGLRGLTVGVASAELTDFVPAIRQVLADGAGPSRTARTALDVQLRYDWRVIGRSLAPELVRAFGVGST